MRRVSNSVIAAQGVRFASGVAPVLYFPPTNGNVSKEEQIKKNTKIALEMIKRFKGPLPPAYTRKTTATIEQLEAEIESLVGSASKLARAQSDDQPMDKLTLIERCLRHAVWSYHKDEGKTDYAEMAKWIVYTAEDESKMALLKRQADVKQKLTAFRAKKAEEGLPEAPVPTFNLTEEYKSVVDRELIDEKRFRYDTLATNTSDRDEAQIEALLQQYRRPAQEKRLDNLVELLERFKPVLAREAIMQRLTIRHLEGQLGLWRYLDWCPEIRDRAELEIDVSGFQWWAVTEERRLLPIRLRSVNEVREIMSATQAQKAAESTAPSSSDSGSASSGNAERDRLLKEVLALQARIHQRDAAEDTKASAAH